MIFDFHSHVFPPEVIENRSRFTKQDAAFDLIYSDPDARMVTAEGLLEAMDRDGVDKSVICGFPWSDPGIVKMTNDVLLDAQQRYPDRLYAFYTPALFGSDEAVMDAEDGLQKGMKGIGETAFYTSRMGREAWSYVRALAQVAGNRGVPFLLHVNEPIGHVYPGKVDIRLRDVWAFAAEQPELTLVLAHWGGGLFFYELMESVHRSIQNIYYDTAASPFLYAPAVYRIALEILGPERILFGSDFPLINPSRYVKEMQEAGLSEMDRKKILGQNALALFNEGPRQQ